MKGIAVNTTVAELDMSISATNAADLATTQTSKDAWQYAVIQLLDGILPKENVQPNVKIQRFRRQLNAWLPQKSQQSHSD